MFSFSIHVSQAMLPLVCLTSVWYIRRQTNLTFTEMWTQQIYKVLHVSTLL